MSAEDNKTIYEIIHYQLRNRFLYETSPSWTTPKIVGVAESEEEALKQHKQILETIDQKLDLPDLVHVVMKEPDNDRVFLHTFRPYDDYEAHVKSGARAAYKEYKKVLRKKFPHLEDERI